MDRHTLLINRTLPSTDLQTLRDSLAPFYKIVVARDELEFQHLNNKEDIVVVMGNKIDGPVIDQLPNLRLIQVLGAGIDNIDLKAIEDRDILVGNSHSNSAIVAEHALALMLSATRRVTISDSTIKERGSWKGVSGDLPKPVSLSHMTVGFFGFGHIAQEIVRLLRPFGSNLFATNQTNELNKPWSTSVQLVTVKTLFSMSDIVVITAPLTPTTAGVVDRGLLGSMKPNSILVNVSRAEIVDPNALYDALKNPGFLAAFDVWWRDVQDQSQLVVHNARDFPNLICSPYWAGWEMGKSTHLPGAISNLIAFAKGEDCEYLADPTKGY